VFEKHAVAINFNLIFQLTFMMKLPVLFRLSGDFLFCLQQQKRKQKNAVLGHLPAKGGGFPKML